MSHSKRLNSGQYDAVLFDLDGTLVDTAPDMVRALQDMQRAHGLPPVDYEFGRSNVSNGARGLLQVGFPHLDLEERQALVPNYIELYRQSLCVETSVFPLLNDLLARLDEASRPWGVVTNKPAHLTAPLMQALGLHERSAATVSGDTLPVRKPEPEPLLHAATTAGVAPGRCIYVGDASRDIEAGRKAGMATIAAGYGYITDDDDPVTWQADAFAADTAELAQILLKAVNLEP